MRTGKHTKPSQSRKQRPKQRWDLRNDLKGIGASFPICLSLSLCLRSLSTCTPRFQQNNSDSLTNAQHSKSIVFDANDSKSNSRHIQPTNLFAVWSASISCVCL